jgi:hypothetical protein
MHRLLVAMLLSAPGFLGAVSAGQPPKTIKLHNFSATAAGPGIFRSNSCKDIRGDNEEYN